MPPPTIRLVPSSSSTQKCSPHLMPFKFDYSGPAPISTFFRAKPSSREIGKPVGKAEAAKRTADGEGDDIERRWHAAFRGRVVHGLEVDLPEGYAGIVFRPDENGTKDEHSDEYRSMKSSIRNQDERKARRTRSSVRAKEEVMDVDEDDGLLLDGENDDEATQDDARTLVPCGTFSALTVWHPDNPVDEGGDEYIRALSEWTSLAAVIHDTT